MAKVSSGSSVKQHVVSQRHSSTLKTIQWPKNVGIGWVIDWVKVLCPTPQKIGHFGDILPSRSLGTVHNNNNNRLRPFVRDYPGDLVPEESLTHPPSWLSSSLYQLLPSTRIHSILPVQITCLAIFLHNLFPCPLWFYLLVWSPPPHIPYISSPNQCLLFAAHAHTITTCFAAVSILYHLFLVFLSLNYLLETLSVFYLNIRHQFDHSHLCSLKCHGHLIFFPDRPGILA